MKWSGRLIAAIAVSAITVGCAASSPSQEAGSAPGDVPPASAPVADDAGSAPGDVPPASAPVAEEAGAAPAEAPTASALVSEEAIPIDSTGGDEERDLIRADDPSSFACLVDLGTGPGEFYDKVSDELVFPLDTSFFEARYSDGSTVEIRIHPELVGASSALAQAERIARPIGLLPPELRVGIARVGFLGGDATAQADGGGEGIHVYESNVAVRESTNRFEETLFHESVHTSLDDAHAASSEWLAARAADGAFLTGYAESNPASEDLAETALYAWALLHHPDRISAADAAAWNTLVPNRIEVISSILSPPESNASGSAPSC